MPTFRQRRQYGNSDPKLGSQTVTLAGVNSGYNGYSNPELTSPQSWAAASQVYSGLFGGIRRARFASLVNSSTVGYVTTGVRFASLFSFAPVTAAQPFVLADYFALPGNPAPIYFQYVSGVLQAFQYRFGTPNGYWNLLAGQFIGPIQRIISSNFVLMANGVVRAKALQFPGVPNSLVLALWGLDAPDASPQVTLNAGLSATIAASPTGAVRNNNVATITTTANHGFTTGQYVTISYPSGEYRSSPDLAHVERLAI